MASIKAVLSSIPSYACYWIKMYSSYLSMQQNSVAPLCSYFYLLGEGVFTYHSRFNLCPVTIVFCLVNDYDKQRQFLDFYLNNSEFETLYQVFEERNQLNCLGKRNRELFESENSD